MVRSGGSVRQVVMRGEKRSGEEWWQRGSVQVVMSCVARREVVRSGGSVAACRWWCVARREVVRSGGSVLQQVFMWWQRTAGGRAGVEKIGEGFN